MKKLITCLAAGLLVIGAQSLVAQTTNSVTPDTQTPAGKHQATPEQRKQQQAVLKILGLTKDDLKDLAPKEHRAKIKETADKYVADAKVKKAAGTLTAEEQTNLDLVQKFLERTGHKKAKAPSDT